MRIHPIRTAEDYDAALSRVEDLWEAPQGSEEADELEVLTTLIHLYEEKHEPILPPEAVEAILFRMEQHGLTGKDLEEILGVHRSRVSEILTRKRALSLDMIRRLVHRLNIPADVFIGPAN